MENAFSTETIRGIGLPAQGDIPLAGLSLLAAEVAREHVAFMRGQGLSATDAWLALTSERRRYVEWDEVSGFMRRWWMSRGFPRHYQVPDARAAL
jgi:hypothetical protein